MEEGEDALQTLGLAGHAGAIRPDLARASTNDAAEDLARGAQQDAAEAAVRPRGRGA